MRLTLYKLLPRDVEALDRASIRLQRIADTIASARYANAPVILQLLAEANDDIERIKLKGAGCIQRSLERAGVQVPGGEAENASSGAGAQANDENSRDVEVG